MIEKIKSIEEVKDIDQKYMPKEGKVQLGTVQMINCLAGGGDMDGYKVVTSKSTYFILIDNGQCCCESWGYITSEDDISKFIGSNLREVVLTDTALNTKRLEEKEVDDLDSGGIQFVTFKTSKGDFQLAVYNGHNGYYGHGILITKDETILLNSTL